MPDNLKKCYKIVSHKRWTILRNRYRSQQRLLALYWPKSFFNWMLTFELPDVAAIGIYRSAYFNIHWMQLFSTFWLDDFLTISFKYYNFHKLNICNASCAVNCVDGWFKLLKKMKHHTLIPNLIIRSFFN